MTGKAETCCIVLASGALVAGFAFERLWSLSFLFVLSGTFWWLTRERVALAAPMMLLCLVGAAGGFWLGLSSLWGVFALLSGVAALCAWDLCAFSRRLSDWQSDLVNSAAFVATRQRLERNHLRRLTVVAGTGWLVAVATLIIHLELSFAAAVLLAVVAALSLSRAISLLKRES